MKAEPVYISMRAELVELMGQKGRRAGHPLPGPPHLAASVRLHPADPKKPRPLTGWTSPSPTPTAGCTRRHRREVTDRGTPVLLPIAAGTLVARLGGRLVDDASSAPCSTPDVVRRHHHRAARRHPCFWPAADQRFGNHSCDPTLASVRSHSAPQGYRAGEEVTVDYATQTTEPDFVLDCGAGDALPGTVTGRLAAADLQERYGEHWARAAPADRRLTPWCESAGRRVPPARGFHRQHRSSACTRSSLAWNPPAPRQAASPTSG